MVLSFQKPLTLHVHGDIYFFRDVDGDIYFFRDLSHNKIGSITSSMFEGLTKLEKL